MQGIQHVPRHGRCLPAGLPAGLCSHRGHAAGRQGCTLWRGRPALPASAGLGGLQHRRPCPEPAVRDEPEQHPRHQVPAEEGRLATQAQAWHCRSSTPPPTAASKLPWLPRMSAAVSTQHPPVVMFRASRELLTMDLPGRDDLPALTAPMPASLASAHVQGTDKP